MASMASAARSALASPPPALREGVRQALTAATQFDRLDAEDRREIAHALVRIAHAAKLLDDAASGPGGTAPVRAMTAADDFSGTAVGRIGDTARQIMSAISFPRFVKELINGVFRAMVETNQQQIQQYVELVRAVSQSLEGFASLGGDDTAARRWLAETFPQSYRLELPEPEDTDPRGRDPDDPPEQSRLVTTGSAPSPEALRAALGLEANAEIPSGGAEALVPFVRRSLAKNRQQVLATMVQMGMQRIVVDSGRIHAAMRFHIDARSAAEEQKRTKFDTRTSVSARASGGFGLWSASAAVESTIGYVQAADRQTREELNASADLNSSVELHFRTDQVPLDRLASQQTTERLRLNTLNPERELDIARQADVERANVTQRMDQARLNRPPLEDARSVPEPRAPELPPRESAGNQPASPPAAGSSGGRQAATPGGVGGSADRQQAGSPGSDRVRQAPPPQAGSRQATVAPRGPG